MTQRSKVLFASVSTVVLALPNIALAQNPRAADRPAAVGHEGVDDIVVTARKRDETSIAVPVVVTAVSARDLDRRGISNLDAVARVVPQLQIGGSSGAVQGGLISLRGISSPYDNPFGDTAVSFNVDGVAIGKTSVRRMADFDLQQIEVLKGPQALFFGKNSPGGIISIRTADPTANWEGKGSIGYEFNAREKRLEGYVSGPLTDQLGLRVAGFFSDMDGWIKNELPNGAYLASGTYDRSPQARNYGVRTTLLYDDDANFSARFKFAYSDVNDPAGSAGTNAYISCGVGARQSGSGGPCGANNHAIVTSLGAAAAAASPANFGDGDAYSKQHQILSSMELNYNLSDVIKLTSVTGFYFVKYDIAANYESDTNISLPSNNFQKVREFSHEVRASSDYDGPLNFTVGGFYSNTYASGGTLTALIAAEPGGADYLAAAFGLPAFPLRVAVPVNNYALTQKGKAYSAFLQMIYKPVDTVEIAIGGRYSHEEKRITKARNSGGFSSPFGFVFPLTAAQDVELDPINKSWNDFSPEISVSYRPTNKLTFFASYKHGFLSGGYNAAGVDTNVTSDIGYDQETIKGFEAGVKALTLDDNLRVNLAVYRYRLAGLQLSNFINTTSTIRNAGTADIWGIDFDATYRTPLPGLSVNGAISYNDAKFDHADPAPCYKGQTIALGCTISDSLGNPNSRQSLDGTTLPNTPKISLLAGFLYEAPLSDALKLTLTGNATYSSSYLTDSSSTPAGRQERYTLLDATVRLGALDDRWSIEFIGRNLSNKYYFVGSNDVPFTGSPAGQATGVLADRYAPISRGRELMVRASYKFGG